MTVITSSSSKIATKGVGIITCSVARKAMQFDLTIILEAIEDLLHANKENEGCEGNSTPSGLHLISNYSTASDRTPIMMTSATSLVNQIIALTKGIKGLTKHT